MILFLLSLGNSACNYLGGKFEISSLITCLSRIHTEMHLFLFLLAHFNAAGVKVGNDVCQGDRACCGATANWLLSKFGWSGEFDRSSPLQAAFRRSKHSLTQFVHLPLSKHFPGGVIPAGNCTIPFECCNPGKCVPGCSP